MNASCSIDSNTLRSPALLSHKDRFGMTCNMINMSVLLEDGQNAEVKLVSPLISVTTTLGWNATRDLMIKLQFSTGKLLPRDKIQCGWLYKEPNAGHTTFRHEGCAVLNVYENSVLCTCTADTRNYALRVERYPLEKEPSVHEAIIKWLTRISLGTSIVLLVVTSLILLYIRKFQTQRIYLLRILCSLSAFSQSVLLAGMHLTEYNTVCQILGIAIHFLSISVLTCQLRFALSLFHFTNCKPENFLQPDPYKVIYCLLGYLLPFTVTVTSYILRNDAYGGDLFCWPIEGDNGFLKYLTIIPITIVSMVTLILSLFALSKRSQLASFYENAYLIGQSIRDATTLSLFTSILLPFIYISALMATHTTHEWDMYLVQYLFAIFNGFYGIAMYTMIVHYNVEVKIGILVQGGGMTKLEEIFLDGAKPPYHH